MNASAWRGVCTHRAAVEVVMRGYLKTPVISQKALCDSLRSLAAAFAVSCTTADPEPGVVVEDSAGVVIVMNYSPAWQPGTEWKLQPQPLLEIGLLDGDPRYEFSRIAGGLMLPNGAIVVADGGSQELRLYDEAGRFLNTIGRAGEGPGEFRSIANVDRLGDDTLVVLDMSLRRLTAFSVAGKPQRESGVTSAGLVPAGRPVWLRDGSLLLAWLTELASSHVADGRAHIGQTVRTQATLVRYDPMGSVSDTVGVFLAREEAIFPSPDGRPMFTFAPFGRTLVYTTSESTIYIGTQDAHQVLQYDPDGTLVRIVRWAGPSLEITDSAAQDLVSRTLTPVADPAERARWESLIRTLPRPDRRAAYGELLTDSDGHLWISAYSYGRARPLQWNVFDPTGRWLGQVSVPAKSRVLEIGGDYMLAASEDELGVEYVRLFQISKAN